MGKFFTIIIATFISILCALATWHYVESYLIEIEAKELKAEAEAKELIADAESEANVKKEVVSEIVKKIKYEWKVEEKTNAVTGERVATATRFSEDIGSALTFRCYGFEKKKFDILVSFPDAISWYKNSADMKFRIDGGSLATIEVKRNSSSVAVPVFYEPKNIKKESAGVPAWLKQLRKKKADTLEFKSIASAELFEASIPDGTIYQQVISIDILGIKDALKPVLALCEKESL